MEREARIAAATFTVSYDGPALDTGTMDVKDLAPALLSLGQLVERANEVVNGDRAEVSVMVKAEMRRGSFGVHIDLVQTVLGSDLWTRLSNANQLMEFLGISGVAGGIGLFKLIKMLRGKKPEVVEKKDGNTTITVGHVNVTVNNTVFNLYADPDARRHAAGVVGPVLKPEIDLVEFEVDGVVTERVDDEDALAFEEVPDDAEGEPIIPDATVQAALEIVKLPLKHGLKWHLANDSMRITAEMKDADFQEKMDSGEELFAVGDVLVILLRTRTLQDRHGRIRTRHFIEKVVSHRRRPSQGRL